MQCAWSVSRVLVVSFLAANVSKTCWANFPRILSRQAIPSDSPVMPNFKCLFCCAINLKTRTNKDATFCAVPYAVLDMLRLSYRWGTAQRTKESRCPDPFTNDAIKTSARNEIRLPVSENPIQFLAIATVRLRLTETALLKRTDSYFVRICLIQAFCGIPRNVREAAADGGFRYTYVCIALHVRVHCTRTCALCTHTYVCHRPAHFRKPHQSGFRK